MNEEYKAFETKNKRENGYDELALALEDEDDGIICVCGEIEIPVSISVHASDDDIISAAEDELVDLGEIFDYEFDYGKAVIEKDDYDDDDDEIDVKVTVPVVGYVEDCDADLGELINYEFEDTNENSQ